MSPPAIDQAKQGLNDCLGGVSLPGLQAQEFKVSPPPKGTFSFPPAPSLSVLIPKKDRYYCPATELFGRLFVFVLCVLFSLFLPDPAPGGFVLLSSAASRRLPVPQFRTPLRAPARTPTTGKQGFRASRLDVDNLFRSLHTTSSLMIVIAFADGLQVGEIFRVLSKTKVEHNSLRSSSARSVPPSANCALVIDKIAAACATSWSPAVNEPPSLSCMQQPLTTRAFRVNFQRRTSIPRSLQFDKNFTSSNPRISRQSLERNSIPAAAPPLPSTPSLRSSSPQSIIPQESFQKHNMNIRPRGQNRRARGTTPAAIPSRE